jgi:hypothetical protein
LSCMSCASGCGATMLTDERRTNDQGPTTDHGDQAFDLLLPL